MKIIPIPEFSGYFAGEDGNIYSNRPLGRPLGVATKLRPLAKLKSFVQSNGKYFIVSVKRDGENKNKIRRVHRLVCAAFHGLPPFIDSTASHLDGDWKNNIPSNLKWESLSDNHKRKKQHGTDDTGIKNSRAMFNLEQIIQIKKWIKQGITLREISKRMHCNDRLIGKIKRGEHYKDQGESK